MISLQGLRQILNAIVLHGVVYAQRAFTDEVSPAHALIVLQVLSAVSSPELAGLLHECIWALAAAEV